MFSSSQHFFLKKGTYQSDQRRNGYSMTGVRGKSYLITLMYLVAKSLRMCFIYVITTIVRTCILLLLIWSGNAPFSCSKKNKKKKQPGLWQPSYSLSCFCQSEWQSQSHVLIASVFLVRSSRIGKWQRGMCAHCCSMHIIKVDAIWISLGGEQKLKKHTYEAPYSISSCLPLFMEGHRRIYLCAH